MYGYAIMNLIKFSFFLKVINLCLFIVKICLLFLFGIFATIIFCVTESCYIKTVLQNTIKKKKKNSN